MAKGEFDDKSYALDLDKLFEGSLRRLRTEADYFSRLTGHNPELGRLNETHLVKLIRDYLPPKIGIGTGFIVSGGENPEQSPQCDIILYDALNNVPFYASDTWSIYPIEMVYGVIEVKTTLNKTSLGEAFDKCAKIRSMASGENSAGNKAYIYRVPSEPRAPVQARVYLEKLPPRFFVFGYSGWSTPDGFVTSFKELTASKKGAHIHGACNLRFDDSSYVAHIAYKGGETVHVEKGGFRHFLMSLPSTLESMLPLHRVGFGFDQVFLKHYDLSIEQGPQENSPA